MTLKKHWQLLLVIAIFLLSRAFIYAHPPKNYSDVKADYERYANMWRYGLTPYRKHLYEYPPATIPLLSWPLDLDQSGVGKYYQNFRTEILIIDVTFFAFLLATMKKKLPWMKTRWVSAALVYIALTTLAHDFFYEGIDLAFTAATFASFFAFVWIKDPDSWLGQIISWTFFWLSTAIKFLTLPLSVPLFLVFRGPLWKRVTAAAIGFFTIWIIPLALYGSSLSVSFVYNLGRPIKYAAFPAYIIQVINAFTHTEIQHHQVPDFEFMGPISNLITTMDKVVFPVTIGLALILSAFALYHAFLKGKWGSASKILQTFLNPPTLDPIQRLRYLLGSYGIYVFALFLTAKTFSQPFHIWYFPLLIIYPFATDKKRWIAFMLALLMVLIDMTPYLYVPSQFQLVRDAFRFIPMIVLLWIFVQDMLSGKVFTEIASTTRKSRTR